MEEPGHPKQKRLPTAYVPKLYEHRPLPVLSPQAGTRNSDMPIPFKMSSHEEEAM
jgi:hypothetical protein